MCTDASSLGWGATLGQTTTGGGGDGLSIESYPTWVAILMGVPRHNFILRSLQIITL